MTIPDMSPTEAVVSAAWSRILGVTPASVEDDFFDLGGQSLHLVQFLQDVWTHWQVELDVADLFATEFTVAECARAIDRAGRSPARST